MSLKSKLGFLYRAVIGLKDNIFDNPKISEDISYFSIGKTIMREDIKCYKFGNGEEKVLYFGGIHGNETGTVKLMNRWVNYLNNPPFNSLPNIREGDYKDKTIYVIPCLNVDGYKKALKNPDYLSGGTIGKTNANDVDLNRNFPSSNWSTKSKLFAAGKYRDISGGKSPASEPEIKALLDLVNRENIKTIYTFHNCWSTVFSMNDSKKLDDYSDKSGYRIYKKSEWDSLVSEQKTGHSMIWGDENNIEIIEVEMKYRYSSEWKVNKEALISSLSI